MPYPNEHAARINSPGKYDQFRRKNDALGRGIDVIYGIKNGKTEIQAIRFDGEKFTLEQARKWLKDHNVKPLSFEAAVKKARSDAPNYRYAPKGPNNCDVGCGYWKVLNQYQSYCEKYDFLCDSKWVCDSWESSLKKTGKWSEWQGEGYKKPRKKPKKKVVKTDFPKKGDNRKISLINSTHKQFDYKYAFDLKSTYPELWKRAGTGGNPPTSFTGDDSFRMWTKYRDQKRTKGVLAWVRRREKFAMRHYNNVGLNGAIAHMKWGTINSSGISGMKKVINQAKKKIDERRRKRRMRKDDVENSELMAVIKNINPEKRIVSGPVLVPDIEDKQNDIISEEEIVKAAHLFMKDFQQINILHSSKYDEFAKDIMPVESTVLKNDLDYYGDGEVHKKGTWILDVFIGNDKVWDLVKDGKIRAYSIEGQGERIPLG